MSCFFADPVTFYTITCAYNLWVPTSPWLWACAWFTETAFCVCACVHVADEFGYMQQFKIRVQRVFKDVVKAFPNGLYRHKNNENDILGYQVN